MGGAHAPIENVVITKQLAKVKKGSTTGRPV